MRMRFAFKVGLWVVGLFAAFSGQADQVEASGQVEPFRESVLPFLDNYCVDCHSGKRAKAKFDVSVYKSEADVIGDFGHWDLILDQLQSKAMPPEEADVFPSAEERESVIDWIVAIRKREAQRNAGDPGAISARRLSNSEYNYTIRDLTGVDLQPTREFPIDPANEAGFDNTGESLSLSPALLKKYLDAAREVADHLALLPNGITFASHPVMTDTDRDKYCVKRIVDFYKRQPTKLSDYFLACVELKKSEEGISAGAIESVADSHHLSAPYLGHIWNLLAGSDHSAGPVQILRDDWQEISVRAEAATDDETRSLMESLANRVLTLRKKLAVEVDFPKAPQIHSGSQTMVYWRNRRQAASRRSLNEQVLKRMGDVSEMTANMDRSLILIGSDCEQEEQLAAFEYFCSIIPNEFYISERGREFLGSDGNSKNEQGRLLSAGLHSMMGYFRDDQPLMELMLEDDERVELDELWRELNFMASAPMRQHAGFVWFERTDSRFMRGEEFDFARAEDKDVTSEEKIRRLGEVYLAKAVDNRADETAQEAIREYFININASVREVERDRLAAESVHLTALLEFMERAFRRPIGDTESKDLVAFYEERRSLEGASHEEAIRDALVSILVSPHFWYRFYEPAEGPGIQPLTDVDLASRLSYFLWSSMPDEELMQLAKRGELRDPATLVEQTRRMIQDPRARALAVEFGGAWLDFRRFENHNSVDRNRFPEFNEGLRQAMFEEPVRLILDVFRNDRSALDFLFAKDTFVNGALAKHYGVSDPQLVEVDTNDPDHWAHLAEAEAVGRGGLLPMAVFQTKNAPGLRTSPVKRGYWVVRQLLGEHIPPPPPNVPELPSDEELSVLSLPEQLARHREDPSCAGCHDRFDGIGLAFEGYGPVGERREMDLGGRPVQNKSEFPGGASAVGLEGLKDYLRSSRQDEFVENLARKLFSYALGRTLILSDDLEIEKMLSTLQNDGYRMQSLLERIVLSPQFLNRQGRVDLAER